MTNEEKIREICSKYGNDQATLNALKEMAEYKDHMFDEAINMARENMIKYYRIDKKIVDGSLDEDRLKKTYQGDIRVTTPEEIEKIKGIMKEEFDYYGDLLCMCDCRIKDSPKFYAINSQDWWRCMAGRFWEIDLNKRTYDCILLS